jgi:hypothetical protein
MYHVGRMQVGGRILNGRVDEEDGLRGRWPYTWAFSIINASDIMKTSNYGGHSAIVNMQLRFNGTAIPIARMGPDYIVVHSTVDYPPCEATIEMSVDGSESRWNVRLPNGISAAAKRVALAAPGSLA